MKQMLKTKTHTLFWFIASLVALPSPCWASGSGITPEVIVQNIINYLTGDLARVVGVCVVVGAGYMYLETQQIQKKTFVRIVIGMGLILGGPTLADMWWG
ncbi:TrbC/VirB2 family protein [Legionella saoudiensis]|uniref:TrbC/VirB2 family protein n=1 Tax=Legionella saoudiensis TaxID=1750561 RepID=UPI0007303395|nr:TrbC/VirB2 family protein [Legionella saoudiensis]